MRDIEHSLSFFAENTVRFNHMHRIGSVHDRDRCISVEFEIRYRANRSIRCGIDSGVHLHTDGRTRMKCALEIFQPNNLRPLKCLKSANPQRRIRRIQSRTTGNYNPAYRISAEPLSLKIEIYIFALGRRKIIGAYEHLCKTESAIRAIYATLHAAATVAERDSSV